MQADNSYFQRREFCFTLDGDIFVRYQSFKDGMELKKALQDRCPSKIDIGPVYTVDPQRRAAYTTAQGGFSPVERELVFDIDISDYDDVRNCGQEGHICSKCWPLMAAAVAILDRGLREDFGFQHILFVFSGRRGLHCWVCDERARRMTDDQRAAVANYFTVYKGQEKGLAKLTTGLEEHPAISRAHAMLQEVFVDYVLKEQNLLEDPRHMDTILQYIPNEPVREEIRKQWACDVDDIQAPSIARWQQLEHVISEECKALRRNNRDRDSTRAAKLLEKGVRDIVFAYTYPRLDVEVSKKMNHLLKAPFCVHPKTGKVCVPIDPATAWTFNPETVCTVGDLLNQLSNGTAQNKTDDANEDLHESNDSNQEKEGWKGTDMADAVHTFRNCFLDALHADAKLTLASKARQAGVPDTLAW